MNDTPETDKIWHALCDSWCNWSVDFAHEKLLDKSRELERERDKLVKDLAAEIKDHTETTAKWNVHHMGLTLAQTELATVTKERDEARRLAEKYRYLSCDSQEEADETLLPWENNQPTEL